MALQIFGTRKCPDTKKAQRFFSDRKIPYQSIDLGEKGISPGELDSVIQAVGADALIDRAGKRYAERGLEHIIFDIRESLLADPALIKTPIVRDGKKAVCGYDPKAWAAFISAKD